MAAQSVTETAKRYAVIVGVSEYQDQDFTPVRFAGNDALRLAHVLLKHGGFDAERIQVLAEPEPQNRSHPFKITRPAFGEVLSKVKYAAEHSGKGDTILFFFAGHGGEASGQAYFATCDTKMDVLKETAVSVTELNEFLGKSKAACVLRFFDTCRSPFGEGRSLLSRMTPGLESAILKTGKGWASFSSCSSGEIAYEWGDFEQGVFSYYLCEGLEGRAANSSGLVTFDRLVDYVRDSVGNWCDEQTRQQTPHLELDLAGTTVLTTVAAAPAPVLLEADSPFQALHAGIERQLAMTDPETRNMMLTTERELGPFFDLVFASLCRACEGFAHASMTISVGEKTNIQGVDRVVHTHFDQELRAKKVKAEFTGKTIAVAVSFSTSEVVLAHTRLTVVAARFSFFYWLWYCNVCEPKQSAGQFTPSPPCTKGFFTFMPKAAADPKKVEDAVREMLKCSSEDSVRWSEQLRQHLGVRMKPLRDMGPIIE